MSEQACHHRQVELRTVAACGAESAVLWLIAWDACCTASHAAHCMACSAESAVLWLLACGNVANCCRLQAVASAQAAAISVQHVCNLSSGSSQSEPGRLNPCLAVAVAGVLQVLSLGSFTCTWPAAVAAVSSAGRCPARHALHHSAGVPSLGGFGTSCTPLLCTALLAGRVLKGSTAQH